MSNKNTRFKIKKDTVSDVRIVEDRTKRNLSVKQVISVVILTALVYLFLNVTSLYDAVRNGNFWETFTLTLKELLDSTNLSVIVFVVVFVTDIANKKK